MDLFIPRYGSPQRPWGIVPPSPPAETEARRQAAVVRQLRSYRDRWPDDRVYMPGSREYNELMQAIGSGIFFPGLAAVRRDVLASGLASGIPALQPAIYYYKLEANTWLDSGPSGLNLSTSASAPTISTSSPSPKIGVGSANFSGSTQYLTHASNAGYTISSNANAGMTQTIWAYPTRASNDRFVILNMGGGFVYGLSILTGSANFVFQYVNGSGGTGTLVSTATITLNAWSLLIARITDVTNGVAGVSINNGTFKNDSSGAGRGSSSGATFYIGAYDTTQLYLAGNAQHAGFWDHDIGSTGYSSIWNSGNGASVY